mmetsp:Transcript_41620/g.102101  ORF Transcript_41620/g.102101 Transcript_41620/m.102101 type:complete len:204 (+) Transcript_41620:407-1018(+)
MPAISGGSNERRLPSRLRISSSVSLPIVMGNVASWFPSSSSSFREDMFPSSGGSDVSSLLESARRLRDVMSEASAVKTLSLFVARLRRCNETRSFIEGGSESIRFSLQCSSSSAVRLPMVRGMVASLLLETSKTRSSKRLPIRGVRTVSSLRSMRRSVRPVNVHTTGGMVVKTLSERRSRDKSLQLEIEACRVDSLLCDRSTC